MHTIMECKISTEVQTKYELNIPIQTTPNLKYGQANIRTTCSRNMYMNKNEQNA